MLSPRRRRMALRLAAAGRSQEGMAMVLVLVLITSILILLSVAWASGTFAAQRSVVDNRVKRALQAADSGAKAATYRINVISMQGLLQSTVPCLAKATGQSATGPVDLKATVELGNTWCPEVSEAGGNNTSFRYQVSRVAGEANIATTCPLLLSCTVTLSRTVVATGSACRFGDVDCQPTTSGATSRRIRVKVSGQMTLRRLVGGAVTIDNPARFRQIEYVECRSAAASGQPPDDGC